MGHDNRGNRVCGLAASLRIVQQYEKAVVFRLGRVVGEKGPGLRIIIPVIDNLRKVSMQISPCRCPQKIITKGNVSIECRRSAYYQVVDATSAGGHSKRRFGGQPDRPDHRAQSSSAILTR